VASETALSLAPAPKDFFGRSLTNFSTGESRPFHLTENCDTVVGQIAMLRQLRMALASELIYHRFLSPICSFAKVSHDVFPVCFFDDVAVAHEVGNPLVDCFPQCRAFPSHIWMRSPSIS
jgi:hypothetical protein